MLSISNLHVSGSKKAPLLQGVSLSLKKGECVGLTGPSGAGKTTLIKTVMGMDGAALTVTGGDITLDGTGLMRLSARERRALCGKTLGFIPQNPMTAFFANVKIGRQMAETYKLHKECGKDGARQLMDETLQAVNLTDTRRVIDAYPSQLSGGMLQRVAMAILLGIKPAYILADEPTSALDRKNRSLLLQLLGNCNEAGILFISHDAEAMKELCSTIYVMQDGNIIETQPAGQFFQAPQQSWSRSFVQAVSRQNEGVSAWKKLR